MNDEEAWERLRGFDLDVTGNDDEIDESDESKMVLLHDADEQTGNETFEVDESIFAGITKKRQVEVKACGKCTTAVSHLQQRISNQAKTITRQAEIIKKLKNEMANYEDLHEENLSSKKRKRDLFDEAMIADSSDKDIKIKELLEENTLLKERLSNPNQVLEKQQTADNVKKVKADKSTEAKARLLPDRPTNVEALFQELQKTFDKKISDLKEFLQVSVDEKFKQQNQEKDKQTYASTASAGIQGVPAQQKQNDVQSFREIMMNARNEELAEERDKKIRSANIVIHGLKETTKDDDKKFAEDLLIKVGMDSMCIKATQRIGKLGANGPLKVELPSEKHKVEVLQNLRNLKDDEKYKGIGITEDFTLAERKLIQEYNARAKEKNETDQDKDNFIWRVRGSPKNGLFIKKFRKTQAQVNQPQ